MVVYKRDDVCDEKLRNVLGCRADDRPRAELSFRRAVRCLLRRAIQSAAAQSRRARLSTTNIVVAEVFTGRTIGKIAKWRTRVFGSCEIAGIGWPPRYICTIIIIYSRRLRTEDVAATRRI